MNRFRVILAAALVLLGVLILGAMFRPQIENAFEMGVASAEKIAQVQATEAPVETEAVTQQEVEIVVEEVQAQEQVEPTATVAPVATEEADQSQAENLSGAPEVQAQEAVTETLAIEVDPSQILEHAAVSPSGTTVLATMSDGTTVEVDVATQWEEYPTPAHMYENDRAVLKENPQPKAPYDPYTYTIGAGETYGFWNEGRFDFPDGTYAVAVGGYGRENYTAITNNGTEPLEISYSGYAHTGFSYWVFPAGHMPNVELLARYALGRYNHCGIAQGCQVAFLRQYSWDGTQAVEVRNEALEEPMVIDNPTVFRDSHPEWASESAGQALQFEYDLLDQKPRPFDENATPATPMGKAHIVFLTSGTLHLFGGDKIELEAQEGTIYEIVLLNEVGDARSFVNFVGLPDDPAPYLLEYNSGEAPHPELWARAQIGTNGIERVVMYTIRYAAEGISLTASADEPVEFTVPLGQ